MNYNNPFNIVLLSMLKRLQSDAIGSEIGLQFVTNMVKWLCEIIIIIKIINDSAFLKNQSISSTER